MSRAATAVLSTENLLHNVNLLKARTKPAKMIAMVKANAYGHGIRSVASRIDGHVEMMGVASIDEALALRKVGVRSPILLAQGVFESSELLIASTEKFHVVFHHETQIEWLRKNYLPLPIQAWVKINTGMGRLGFDLERGHQAWQTLDQHKSIAKPVRIMSHFACSDEKDHPLNQEQIQAFQGFIQGISSEFSLCNSAGLLNFPDCHYDYVRPGLAMYGVSPIAHTTAADLGLKPVMTLQSCLTSVQTLKKGSTIGYGARYQCPENMPVGMIAFGYGDGYPLSARDGTPVLVNHEECKLIGRISMDMMAVDLRSNPSAKVGDPVILWGGELPLERVTEHTSTIPWAMLTGVQHRVKFLWTQGSG